MVSMEPLDRAVPSPAEPFVRALVPLAGQLHMVLSHMEQFAEERDPAADVPPVPDILAGLLDSILTPLARRRPDDLARATEVLDAVAKTVESELFLVSRDAAGG